MNKFVFEPLDGEEWKPINGFFGYYISNFGRIWSEKQKKRFLNTSKDGCGYIKVRLYINNKSYSKLVHRLVAEAFICNPNRYKEINHKDEDKENNRADNLEWCTRSYNIVYGKAGKERYEKMRLTQRYSRKDLQPVECINKENNSLALDTKAYWLANTCRKAMWEDRYDNNDEKNTLDYWKEWLKQPHSEKE